MFKVCFRERVQIDSWRVRDVARSVVLRGCWFSGGLLYGWRDRFNVVTLSRDLIDSIEDINALGALIDVAASFAAGKFAYGLPF